MAESAAGSLVRTHAHMHIYCTKKYTHAYMHLLQVTHAHAHAHMARAHERHKGGTLLSGVLFDALAVTGTHTRTIYAQSMHTHAQASICAWVDYFLMRETQKRYRSCTPIKWCFFLVFFF